MKRRLITVPLSIACLMFTSLFAQAQQRPYRGTYQSVRTTILRLENRANLFRNSMQMWAGRNGVTYGPAEDINVMAGDFNDSVRQLRDRFDRRQATTADVQDVLTRAARIDDFVRRNSVDVRTQNYWTSIREDLNRLATAYNVSWNLSSYYPPSDNAPYGNRYGVQVLAGTYRLNPSRSDDVRSATERAARNLSYNDRTRVLDMISRRLDPPEEMAIDVRGRTVTLASTRAPQASFDADGRERTETGRSGNTVHSRAWLAGNQLTIDSNGDRGNEFHVTFQPMENGRTLVVTRRIYTPELNQSVEVRSMYDKTSDVARFDIYNPQNAPDYPSMAYGNFVVPDGTRIVGSLENNLSTRTAAVGDRFTLRVTDPVEFQDATIEGHVSQIQRSGRLTGRSVMTLDFDRIRLRDGRSYQFGGILEGVTSNDDSVRVDTEGAVRDESQTNRTGERAAIGTTVGAIIGAIAGGGKGAAIGAIVGASAGAGSIYAEGRNALELNRGAQLIIRAGAPLNVPR